MSPTDDKWAACCQPCLFGVGCLLISGNKNAETELKQEHRHNANGGFGVRAACCQPCLFGVGCLLISENKIAETELKQEHRHNANGGIGVLGLSHQILIRIGGPSLPSSHRVIVMKPRGRENASFDS
jgi:hypothetical protein